MNYIYDKHFINAIWCVRKKKQQKKNKKNQ